MYLGDVKNCKALLASANYPYPEDFNPADHTVQTFAVKPGSEDECRQRISAILENVKESESAQTIGAEIKTILNQTAKNVKRLVTRRGIYKASWLEHFWLAIR